MVGDAGKPAHRGCKRGNAAYGGKWQTTQSWRALKDQKGRRGRLGGTRRCSRFRHIANMAKSAVDQIRYRLSGITGLYNRLVLVVGPAGSGKTATLRSISDSDHVPVLNVGTGWRIPSYAYLIGNEYSHCGISE